MLIPQCIIFCLGRNDHIIVTKWRSGISALILYVFPLLLNLWVKKLFSSGALHVGCSSPTGNFVHDLIDAASPLPETRLHWVDEEVWTKRGMMAGLSRTYGNIMTWSMSTKSLASTSRGQEFHSPPQTLADVQVFEVNHHLLFSTPSAPPLPNIKEVWN